MKIKSYEFAILLSFLMKSLFYGPGIYSILKTSLQDSVISVLLAFLIGLIPLYLFYLLIKNNIKNNYLTNIFIIFHASLILFNLTNFVNSQFLFQTPTFIITILFSFTILYITNKDITTIARAGTIFFLINIILFLIPSFSLFNKTDLSLVKPIMDNGISSILISSFKLISLNIFPIFILLNLNKNIYINKKYIFIIYSYIFLEFISIIFICITVLGIELANLYQFPEFHILKTINIASFLQRIETILSTEWIFDSIISISLCIKSINKNNSNYKYIILISIISYLIFKNNPNAFEFYNNKYPIIITIFLFILPISNYIILKIFKRYKKT